MKHFNLPSPLKIGAGAVYPYSVKLISQFSFTDKYGEPFTLFEIVGNGLSKRVVVPRCLSGPISPQTKNLISDGRSYDFESSFIPRSDQQKTFVDRVSTLLLGGQSFIAEAYAGFGKSPCACEIIARVRKKTLIIVHKEDLKEQWLDTLKSVLGLAYGDGVGLIQGDICKVKNCKVVIGFLPSVSKLDRYPVGTFDDFGLVIWDEVHKIGADTFSLSGFRCPAKLRLGLSATAYRSDGRDFVFRAHIGEILVREEKALVGFRVVVRKSPWVIPKVVSKGKVVPLPHTFGRTAHVEKLLAKHQKRNALITSFLVAAYKKGRNIMLMSFFKEHLKVLFSLAQKEGIPVADMGYYIGGLKEEEREEARKKRVLFCTYKMTESGTNIVKLDTLIMATPRADVNQIVGRILREGGEDKDPVVFDIVDEDSTVFSSYASKRRKFYESRNAKIHN